MEVYGTGCIRLLLHRQVSRIKSLLGFATGFVDSKNIMCRMQCNMLIQKASYEAGHLSVCDIYNIPHDLTHCK